MKFSDEDIKTMIVNRLNWDSRVDASKVLVEVDKGILSLLGTVRTYGERREAFETAREVKGVRIVDNQLTVLIPCNISLPADGIVTLKGKVNSYPAEKKAFDAAMHTLGVVGIVNNLDVAIPPPIVGQ